MGLGVQQPRLESWSCHLLILSGTSLRSHGTSRSSISAYASWHHSLTHPGGGDQMEIILKPLVSDLKQGFHSVCLPAWWSCQLLSLPPGTEAHGFSQKTSSSVLNLLSVFKWDGQGCYHRESLLETYMITQAGSRGRDQQCRLHVCTVLVWLRLKASGGHSGCGNSVLELEWKAQFFPSVQVPSITKASGTMWGWQRANTTVVLNGAGNKPGSLSHGEDIFHSK